MTNLSNRAMFATSRAALAAAFDEWQRRHQKDPESFASDPGATYGEECADYLIELLQAAKA